MNEINFNIEDIEKIDLSMDVGIKEIYPPLENLTVEPTKEQQVFTHENSYGYDNVSINPIPDEYIIPEGTLDVVENGDVDVTMFSRARVGVYVPPVLQDKNITINENGTHNIVADEGYDGLNQVSVTVDAIEDLTEELAIYDSELTEQETTIDNIIGMLKSKGIDDKEEEVVINANTEEDVNNIITQAVDSYIKNSKKLAVESYDIYSNEPATLYTPSKEHTNYLIRCRGTNSYGIVWFAENISLQRKPTGADFYSCTPRLLQYQIGEVLEPLSVFEGVYNTTTDGYVSSTTYTTFEEAVEAIKNPNTTYTVSSGGSTWTAQIAYNTSHSSYLALASNMACYAINGKDFEKSRRISSDETIIVIGTGEVLTNE